MNLSYAYDGIIIECLLDCTEAITGARERACGGIPLEPDYPASAELLEARVGGVNILPLLSDSIVSAIEWRALKCYLQQ